MAGSILMGGWKRRSKPYFFFFFPPPALVPPFGFFGALFEPGPLSGIAGLLRVVEP